MLGRILRDEAGGPLVEAAFVMPVFLLLLGGGADLTIYMWQRNIANMGAQLGARSAVTAHPVAIGDGLPDDNGLPTPSWNVSVIGKPCLVLEDPGTSRCPMVDVTCTYTDKISCTSGYAPNESRFRELAAKVGAKDPRDLSISYRWAIPDRGMFPLGFVGKPGAVPVHVTVTICRPYQSLVLKAALGWTGPALCPGYPGDAGPKIAASATLPSEDLAGPF